MRASRRLEYSYFMFLISFSRLVDTTLATTCVFTVCGGENLVITALNKKVRHKITSESLNM